MEAKQTLADLRRPVAAFALEMERRLLQKDGEHPDGWAGADPGDLGDCLESKWRQLNRAVDASATADSLETIATARDMIRQSSADLANYAMMILDVTHGLYRIPRLNAWSRYCPLCDDCGNPDAPAECGHAGCSHCGGEQEPPLTPADGEYIQRPLLWAMAPDGAYDLVNESGGVHARIVPEGTGYRPWLGEDRLTWADDLTAATSTIAARFRCKLPPVPK